MGKRFTRNLNDKIFGGVCSGLADYTGFDKSLIRVIALIGIIATGLIPGLFLYLICVIIVPGEDHARGDRHESVNYNYDEPEDYSAGNGYGSGYGNGNSRVIFGVILIGAGAFLLLRMIFTWLDWRYLFAGVLILAGLYMFFGNARR